MKRIKMSTVIGVKSNVHNSSLVANRAGRAGAIPGCVLLAAADVGRARVGRRSYWTTWGRNIPATEIKKFTDLGFTTIWMGADDGSVELVIGDNIAEKLLSILV